MIHRQTAHRAEAINRDGELVCERCSDMGPRNTRSREILAAVWLSHRRLTQKLTRITLEFNGNNGNNKTEKEKSTNEVQ